MTIPLGIAFNPVELDSVGCTIFDSFIDLIFFIDIFVNFRTSYISTQNGEEIYDPKLIAKKYILGGRFIIDLLSSIPFDKLAGNNDILPILGMLKLFRVARISDVIRNLSIKKETKAMLKVLWLVVFLFLYSHVIACLWYYVVKDAEKWVPNKDFVFGGTYYIWEFYAGDGVRRYLVCFYTAFYLISSGEMCPRRNIELLLASTIFFVSSIILSNLFGTMAVLA